MAAKLLKAPREALLWTEGKPTRLLVWATGDSRLEGCLPFHVPTCVQTRLAVRGEAPGEWHSFEVRVASYEPDSGRLQLQVERYLG